MEYNAFPKSSINKAVQIVSIIHSVELVQSLKSLQSYQSLQSCQSFPPHQSYMQSFTFDNHNEQKSNGSPTAVVGNAFVRPTVCCFRPCKNQRTTIFGRLDRLPLVSSHPSNGWYWVTMTRTLS